MVKKNPFEHIIFIIVNGKFVLISPLPQRHLSLPRMSKDLRFELLVSDLV